MFGQETDDMFTKAMFGQHARHIPMWMKVQDQGDGTVIFAGSSKKGTPIRYGSNRTHQLILGEMIVRPHLVCASDEFKGCGVDGLLTEMDIDTWIKEILIDNMGTGDRVRNMHT
jgi:hypothetical protein